VEDVSTPRDSLVYAVAKLNTARAEIELVQDALTSEHPVDMSLENARRELDFVILQLQRGIR
jgi:hypothetical protein